MMWFDHDKRLVLQDLPSIVVLEIWPTGTSIIFSCDAAGNPVDRAELGLDVTNSFNNLNQIVTGSWTGTTVTVAGSVNYPAGSISVNNTPGTVYPDASFDVPGVPVVPGTNTLTATYTGPAFTNVPMTATDTSTVVLGDTAYTHDANGKHIEGARYHHNGDLALSW